MALSGSDSGAFDRFLHWLSRDRRLAVQQFEEIKKKLRKYFVRKSCADADLDELVDRTNDRVLMIEDRWQQYQSPLALCCGVARNVWREYNRQKKPEPIGDRDFPSPPKPGPDLEKKLKCLEGCMAKLPEISRDLITRLYKAQKPDKHAIKSQLAAEHGGSGNLRTKACRIRAQLRTCVTTCVAQGKIN
jgi:hypothetical protein